MPLKTQTCLLHNLSSFLPHYFTICSTITTCSYIIWQNLMSWTYLFKRHDELLTCLAGLFSRLHRAISKQAERNQRADQKRKQRPPFDKHSASLKSQNVNSQCTIYYSAWCWFTQTAMHLGNWSSRGHVDQSDRSNAERWRGIPATDQSE